MDISYHTLFYSNRDSPPGDTPNKETCSSRKRKRRPETWNRNINKRRRQAGLYYTNARGKVVEKRSIKNTKDCVNKCKFECSIKISQEERSKIHDHFWALNDQQKSLFYGATTEFSAVKRKRGNTDRRKNSIKYIFKVEDNPVRVCKKFYLGTLDISQRRINYFHKNVKDKVTGVPREMIQGKHQKKTIPEVQKKIVRDHIESFPKINSHYCRSTSSKEYLDSSLSVAKMYNLYLEMCTEKGLDPVKLHLYNHIFNFEYNLAFHKPKKDRCDLCEEFKMKEKEGTIEEDLQAKYNDHLAKKIAAKQDRDEDRQNNDAATAVVCFDLEKVINLPRANISSFYYKRKLSVFNLTAHCSCDRYGYCAIWCEGTAGRGGNEIASALVSILEKVLLNNPLIKNIILWSDSCVPQNKNSIMSLAIIKFLKDHPEIGTVTQKFCEPGHSNIQEVDSIHSQIERSLDLADIYSPISLIRQLLRIKYSKKPLKVVQLTHDKFFDYQKGAKLLNFDGIPYTQLKTIVYSGDEIFRVTFKRLRSETDEEVHFVKRKSDRSRKEGKKVQHSLPVIKQLGQGKNLPVALKKDLRSMFKFFPEVDKIYMKNICNKK